MFRQGFSLVELLIVLAIIGILAKLGIAKRQMMLMKSKQTEAKVGLAGLRVAESAFFAEHAVYGNRLDKIGYSRDGASRNYAIGFPDSNCNDDSNIYPTSGETSLDVTLPNYWTGTPITVSPRTVGSVPQKCLTGGGLSGHPIIGLVGPWSAYQGFIASATGAIAPGVMPDTMTYRTSQTERDPAMPVLAFSVFPTGTVYKGYFQDAWTIDHSGLLINATDGTTEGAATGFCTPFTPCM